MRKNHAHSLLAIFNDLINPSSILGLNIRVFLLFQAMYTPPTKPHNTIKNLYLSKVLYFKVILANSMLQFIDNSMQIKINRSCTIIKDVLFLYFNQYIFFTNNKDNFKI